MLTDIEIAQNAKMKNITDIASDLGISADEIEPYGHYKAKISDSVMKRLADKKDGKLVLAAAIRRLFLWRTSISISRAICTPSPLPTTLCAQCLITVFSRGTSLI